MAYKAYMGFFKGINQEHYMYCGTHKGQQLWTKWDTTVILPRTGHLSKLMKGQKKIKVADEMLTATLKEMWEHLHVSIILGIFHMPGV